MHNYIIAFNVQLYNGSLYSCVILSVWNVILAGVDLAEWCSPLFCCSNVNLNISCWLLNNCPTSHLNCFNSCRTCNDISWCWGNGYLCFAFAYNMPNVITLVIEIVLTTLTVVLTYVLPGIARTRVLIIIMVRWSIVVTLERIVITWHPSLER